MPVRQAPQRAIDRVKFQVGPDEFVDWVGPKDKWQLREWMRRFFGLTIPSEAICQGHSAPLDAVWASYSAVDPVVVWKASRGLGGKSTLMAGLSLLELADGMDVVVLGGSARQSKRVHEVESEAWKYQVDAGNGQFLDGPLRALLAEEPTSYTTKTRMGNSLVAIAASQKSARGPHPQRLRMDEVDELDFEIFNAAMGQPMEGKGFKSQTTLSSTHQYPDGTMTKILELAKERKWPVFEWCTDPDIPVSTPDGYTRLGDLHPGDCVLSFDGTQLVEDTVINAWSTGVKPTLDITVSGKLIRFTGNHEILTEVGWKRADQLKSGDRVAIQGMQGVRREACSSGPERALLAVLSEQSDAKKCGRTGCDRCSSNGESGTSLSGVQQDTAFQIKAVSCVLPKTTSRTQYGSGVENGGCQRAGAREEGFSCGAECKGAAGCVGVSVGAICSDRSLQRGFACSIKKPADRSVRLASHAGGESRARCTETASVSRFGVFDSGPVGRQTTSVGYAVVERVEPGPTIEVWDLAVAKNHNFVANGVVVHNCYRESAGDTGWLSQSQIAVSKSTVSRRMWEIEFELQEPNTEDRLLQTDDVLHMFSGHALDDRPGRLYEFERPVDMGLYATGADWGKTLDWTIVWTWRYDCDPIRLVAYERVQREAWPVMVKRFEKRLRRWGGVGCHDAHGNGSVVADLIDPDLNVIHYIATGDRHTKLYADYVSAIEQKKFHAPRLAVPFKEHKTVGYDDIYRGGGHPPDTVSVGALAYQAVLGRRQIDAVKRRPAKMRRILTF